MATVRPLRTDPTRATRTLTWVPVTDATGRTRMEMRWHVGAPAPRIRRKAAA
ncbi:hypothetical protein SGUI_1070 [Serinicoccus hydrothermalis]|uniref:Uncharacterized protein n=1 Tax=Serinicoccus hydrothermalis TaxID=1758689 RepID=A0A1B1NAK7_9MICO|nr:hypothetical protein [Serinicoccus hydrothermalis]ANS78466.1 hypothetical protein SGUI_1070 [Serinicoccus hydrothermalis]